MFFMSEQGSWIGLVMGNSGHNLLLTLGFIIWIYPCTSSEVQEKIICEYDKINIRCSSGTIRMIEAIYGIIVGQDFCNKNQTVRENCTLPAYCYIFDKVNGLPTSQRPEVKNSLMGGCDPCHGIYKYLIVKYRCGQWSAPASENFALEKPVSQSTNYFRQFASLAVDGKVYKDYSSCASTQEQTDPWWRVDLQQKVRVTHVKIYNRNSHGERLCGFEIRITESPVHGRATRNRCGELKHIRQNSSDVVICRPPVTGRYVTIAIPGSKKILTLCEVQVYGTSVLELPRCYPPNITVSRVTSTSVRIDWNRLLVPKTETDHYKYSVSLSRVQDNYQYLRTTEETSQSINNLRPYRQYNFTVTAVDLGECFGDGYSSNFTTKEDENSRERTSDSSQIVYIVIIAVQFVIIIILAVVMILIRRNHGSRSSQTEVVDKRCNTALQERTNKDQIALLDDVIGHYEQLNRQKDENEHTYQSLQT